jgi:hypothetical protein
VPRGSVVNLLTEDDDPSEVDAIVLSCNAKRQTCEVRLLTAGGRSSATAATCTVAGKGLRVMPPERLGKERMNAALDHLHREEGARLLRSLALGREHSYAAGSGLPLDLLRSTMHDALGKMRSWATPEHLALFLKHPARLKRLANRTAILATEVGMALSHLSTQVLGSSRTLPTFVLPCRGCNNALDAGLCQHEGARLRIELPMREGNIELARKVHELLELLTVATHLVICPTATDDDLGAEEGEARAPAGGG